MLQVRKLHFCGISAIFSSVVLFVKQVLMAVSDFSGFISKNHFLEGDFTFQ